MVGRSRIGLSGDDGGGVRPEPAATDAVVVEVDGKDGVRVRRRSEELADAACFGSACVCILFLVLFCFDIGLRCSSLHHSESV
ncbi:hypothetical protein RYX36_018142 [Vicia faba]